MQLFLLVYFFYRTGQEKRDCSLRFSQQLTFLSVFLTFIPGKPDQMKKLVYLIALTYCSLTSFSQSDSLFAVVDSNYVTLWDMYAVRNCAAYYDMNIAVEDNQIQWVQDDIGTLAYCFCDFDLSVTFGPLEAGIFQAKVYCTYPYSNDTSFIGNIDFEIEDNLSTDSLSISDEYQSLCYPVNVSENIDRLTLSVQPNPFFSKTNFKYQIDNPQHVVITVYNQFGRPVDRIQEYCNSGINRTEWIPEDLPEGVYYIRIQAGSETMTGKLILMK